MKLIRTIFIKNILLFFTIFLEIISIDVGINYIKNSISNVYLDMFFINFFQKYLPIIIISLGIGKIVVIGIEFIQKTTAIELPKTILLLVEGLTALIMAFIVLLFTNIF